VNQIYRELSERIRGDLKELNYIAQRATQSWTRGKAKPEEQDVYLESVALNLHGFYSGIERLFEMIARHVDQDVPIGDTWHRDLLLQMTTDIENIRPAIISQESATSLDEFRRFRHLVRNIYTFNLVPEKMASLLTSLSSLWEQLQAELLAFADFVEEMAKADTNQRNK
jgi:hypothetical protein